MIATFPMKLEPEAVRLRLDDHLFQDRAQDPFARFDGGGGVVPRVRQVIGQRDQRRPFGFGDAFLGLRLLRRPDFVFQPRHFSQPLVPPALQFTGHDPVFRLNRIILPSGTSRLEAGLLQGELELSDSVGTHALSVRHGSKGCFHRQRRYHA
jgi:hypothetical protein